MALANLCSYGFAQCGTSQHKNTVPMLLGFDESLSQAATRRPGSGCTSCEGLWLDQDETDFLGVFKWTKPTLVDAKVASEVEGQKGRLW